MAGRTGRDAETHRMNKGIVIDALFIYHLFVSELLIKDNKRSILVS